MAVAPQLVAVIPNEGATISDNQTLGVAPRQLTFRFDDGQVIDAVGLSPTAIRVTGAGGDGAVDGVGDVPVKIGFLGLGNQTNEVVIRFASSLPDDLYQIQIVGGAIRNTMGQVFNNGQTFTRTFRLDLGAQVLAVVPQPVTRNAQGVLSQSLDTIDVYFSPDRLNPTAAQNPGYYQLMRTGDTSTNLDDGPPILPLSATYDAAQNRVRLKFSLADLTASDRSLRLRIGNDDPLPVPPAPEVSVADVRIIEGNAGTVDAVFQVKLSSPSTQAITVQYATADGSALAGEDYTETNGTLTFAPGVTSQTVTVAVNGDTTDEHTAAGAAAESFLLNLVSSVGGLLVRPQATGQIVDDDGPSFLTVNNVTQAEGNANQSSFVFTVNLLPASAQTVRVKYRTENGGATAPLDFLATSGTLTFQPGQSEKKITVTVRGDTLAAADKDFRLVLSDPQNAVLIDGTGTGLIVDDDSIVLHPPKLAVDPGSSFSTSYNLGIIGPNQRGLQSTLISSSIDPQNYTLPFPGDILEPGHRNIPGESHIGGAGDQTGGVPTIPFNFRDDYGVDPQGNALHNLITENQKILVREIFGFYSRYIGAQFVETARSGLTIVTGDLRALDPTIPTGPGGVAGLAGGGIAIMDNAEPWDDRGPESGQPGLQSYFQVAMHEIGHLLGLGHTYDLPPLTIQGSGSVPQVSAGSAEPVFPGDHDIVHSRYLYRPDVTDIDLYQFKLNQPGVLDLETVAQRLADPSALDTTITLYDSTHREIARNDDYFSKDSFLHLQLPAGQYFVAITSTGNTYLDPTIENSAIGGRTQGDYQLRFNFTPNLSQGIVDATGTALDGDADGRAGGTFNFWFKANTSINPAVVTNTLFVDKAATTDGNGSLATPFRSISTALAIAKPGQIVRIVANGGADGNLATLTDNLAYNIGRDLLGRALADGETLDVPQAVTLMIDAGAIVKFSGANIDVGSSGQGVDHSHAALQVLGIPGTPVQLTAYNDKSIGVDQGQLSTTLAKGDWGGIAFRDDSDYEAQGVFLNTVTHANIAWGGGLVGAGSTQPVNAPIFMVAARPSVRFNVITHSANAALSADPNSFEESEYQNSTFTADYRRSGPDIHGNILFRTETVIVNGVPRVQDVSDNSINGLFIRIRTDSGENLDPLTVSAMLDDTDIVYYLGENLVIKGEPTAAVQVVDPSDPNPANPTRFKNVSRLSARLAVAPGAILKFNSSRIETRIGGQFLAEGTAQNQIVFTSAFDDRYGAGGVFDTTNDSSATLPTQRNWSGLYFGHLATASIDHTLITYAGGESSLEGSFDAFNAVEIHQADVRIASTIFERNGSGRARTDRVGRGSNDSAVIFVRGAQPILLDNIIRNNQGAAISINVNSLNSDLVADYGRSTGSVDLVGPFRENFGPLVRGNRLQNNSLNGMLVRGGTLTTQSVWDDVDMVHVVESEILAPDFHTNVGLRLVSTNSASLVVKLSGPDAGFTAAGRPLDIDDRLGGALQVIGMPGRPVIMTALADDTAGAGLDPSGRPLLDTNNDGTGDSAAKPNAGSWRGIKLAPLSNDRNVEVVAEFEQSFSATGDTNSLAATAQPLGMLAPDLLNGDDHARLGFEVHGAISQAFDSFSIPQHIDDVDVYSFQAKAGTEVWFDVDKTSQNLDAVVELIDANNAVIARSTDSPQESQQFATPENLATGSASGATPRRPGGIGAEGAGLARVMQRGVFSEPDRYTINPRDPGMRVVLPGAAGQTATYYVRVRSQSANLNNQTGGTTAGVYQLQLRLQERDEIPGSTVRYADIRYATIGIDIQGKPGHSPLLAEVAEGAANDSLVNAQDLGRLLTSDRNTLSVAGNLGANDQVDWYKFTVKYDLTQVIGGLSDKGKSWATMFDIDYADGASRPDTTISVFDSNGRLLLVGRDSNVADDQSTSGANTTSLSGGSFGRGDALIGSVQLPEGVTPNSDPPVGKTYYVAVSSARVLPQVLGAQMNPGTGSPLVRLEPLGSVRRIAEDHIGAGDKVSTAGTPAPSLNLKPSTTFLSDVPLYVNTTRDLFNVNPFTGGFVADVTGNNAALDRTWAGSFNNADFYDIVMRNDGRLFTTVSAAGAANDGNQGLFGELDVTSGAPIGALTDDAVQTVSLQGTPPVPTGSNLGIRYDALSYDRGAPNNRRLFGIGGSSDGTDLNLLYELDPNTGVALGQPANPLAVPSDKLPKVGLAAPRIGADVKVVAGSDTRLADKDSLSIKVGPTTVKFEIDFGVTIKVKSGVTGANIIDKSEFTIADVARGAPVTVTFRFNKSGAAPVAGKFDVPIAAGANQKQIASAIATAISASGQFPDLTPTLIQPAGTDIYLLDASPQLASVNVQGLPAAQFDVNADGLGDPAAVPVRITPFFTAGQVAAALATAINGSVLGASIGAVNTRDVVTLTGPTTQLAPTITLGNTGPEFTSTNLAPGNAGIIQGMAIGADPLSGAPVLFAVTSTGRFLVYNDAKLFANAPSGMTPRINPVVATEIRDASLATPALYNFTGLTMGPANADGGKYANTLFATTADGQLVALSTLGVPQAVFAGGAKAVNTGIAGLAGLAFSPIDFNLWHQTTRRRDDAGHGVTQSWDNNTNRKSNTRGGTSYWFGVEDPNARTLVDPTQQPGVGNFSTNNTILNTYDVPGGARGSLVSDTFSLKDYSPTDKPVLYFNYLLDSERATSTPNDYTTMRDAFRVYISDDGANWTELATNNSVRTDANNLFELPEHWSASGGFYRGDIAGNQQVQELFDYQPDPNDPGVVPVWRQARIDLGDYVGVRSGELTVAGGGGLFRDGDTFSVIDTSGRRAVFEFDSNAQLADNTHLAVTFTSASTAAEMATAIGDAVANASSLGIVAVSVTNAGNNRLRFQSTSATPGIPTVDENSNGLLIRTNEQLRLRFDFSTSATYGVGDPAQAGDQLAAIAGADLNDGESFAIDGQVFEFDKGLTLAVATGGGVNIADGALLRLTLGGVSTTFEFDKDGVTDAANLPIGIADTSTPAGVATAIDTALQAAGLTGLITTLHGSRVDLAGASAATVTTPGLHVEGDAPGRLSNAAPVLPVVITGAMTSAEVATAIGHALDAYSIALTGGTDNLNIITTVQVDGPFIHLPGHVVNTAGPLGYSNRLSTDIFGSAGGGRTNNRFEGAYLDDIVIGFAERGEMVTGLPTDFNDTTYMQLPQGNVAGLKEPNTIQRGAYQLEIRRGTEYGIVVDGDLVLSRSFDTNDRLASGVTLQALSGANIREGAVLTLSDGVRSAVFEFDSDGQLAPPVAGEPVHIRIAFGVDDAPDQVTSKVRAAINNQNQIAVKAGPDNALSTNRVDLFGATGADLSTGAPFIVRTFTTIGDANLTRDQGYTIIQDNRISNSSEYGIVVQPGPRTESGNQSQPSAVATLREPNQQRLVPGVSVENNVLYNGGLGGIRFTGDDGTLGPPAAVLFGRLINNTIYGGVVATGIGIDIGPGASPTILNNIIASTQTAIDVDVASSAVIGYNLYKSNRSKFSRPVPETQSIDLADTDPLFVDSGSGNFIPARGSKAIDSSINSLQERAALQTVTGAIGISPSPILAPDTDLLGQQRVDDPTVPSPPGLGSNIFKDRGAIDRADFVGPTAALLSPVDNDLLGMDRDSATNRLLLPSASSSQFAIQFLDSSGVGVDDTTASQLGNYTLLRNGIALQQGTDFIFSYDSTNHVARFEAVAGVWADGTYSISLLPAAGLVGIRDLAENPLLPNDPFGGTKFSITFSPRATTGWQNPRDSLDVNDSGTLTPLDALIIINRLNSIGPGRLPTPASPPPYYDVNGDGLATALDVLAIIDQLNLRSLSGGVQSSTLLVAIDGVIDAVPAPSLPSAPQDSAARAAASDAVLALALSPAALAAPMSVGVAAADDAHAFEASLETDVPLPALAAQNTPGASQPERATDAALAALEDELDGLLFSLSE